MSAFQVPLAHPPRWQPRLLPPRRPVLGLCQPTPAGPRPPAICFLWPYFNDWQHIPVQFTTSVPAKFLRGKSSGRAGLRGAFAIGYAERAIFLTLYAGVCPSPGAAMGAIKEIVNKW